MRRLHAWCKNPPIAQSPETDQNAHPQAFVRRDREHGQLKLDVELQKTTDFYLTYSTCYYKIQDLIKSGLHLARAHVKNRAARERLRRNFLAKDEPQQENAEAQPVPRDHNQPPEVVEPLEAGTEQPTDDEASETQGQEGFLDGADWGQPVLNFVPEAEHDSLLRPFIRELLNSLTPTPAIGRIRGGEPLPAISHISQQRRARSVLNEEQYLRYVRAAIHLPPELEARLRQAAKGLPEEQFDAYLREFKAILRAWEFALAQGNLPGVLNGEAQHAPLHELSLRRLVSWADECFEVGDGVRSLIVKIFVAIKQRFDAGQIEGDFLDFEHCCCELFPRRSPGDLAKLIRHAVSENPAASLVREHERGAVSSLKSRRLKSEYLADLRARLATQEAKNASLQASNNSLQAENEFLRSHVSPELLRMTRDSDDRVATDSQSTSVLAVAPPPTERPDDLRDDARRFRDRMLSETDHIQTYWSAEERRSLVEDIALAVNYMSL